MNNPSRATWDPFEDIGGRRAERCPTCGAVMLFGLCFECVAREQREQNERAREQRGTQGVDGIDGGNEDICPKCGGLRFENMLGGKACSCTRTRPGPDEGATIEDAVYRWPDTAPFSPSSPFKRPFKRR